jgi:poly [ADP-ribose] polymerase
MSKWDKTLYEKTHKGAGKESYVDVTSMASVNSNEKGLDIKDAEVKKLIDFLMKAAHKTLSNAYLGTVKDVTQAQIDEAQATLDLLAKIQAKGTVSVEEANALFIRLYRAIPRKMGNVNDFLLKTADFKNFNDLIIAEQNLLDTLSSQVTVSSVKAEKITLESLGIDVEVASQADRDRIAAETDFRVSNQRIFKVVNEETEKAFRTDLKTKLLYHGSRNENWMNILMTGLKIRPSGVKLSGSMFGDGIYGANKAIKSIGYTSLRGSCWAGGASDVAYLAIFEFATGKEWKVLDGKRWTGSMSDLDYAKCQAHGFDSVFARGGADLRNDEFIVYKPNQCTIRYLIEIKN